MKSAHSSRELGISLVEMMIALSIGLLLTVSLGYILSGSLQIFRVQGENANIQESGRFLMDSLGRQIVQAGYTAISPVYNNTKLTFTGTPVTGEHGVLSAHSSERKSGSDYLALSFDANVDCRGNAAVGGTVLNEFYLNGGNQLVCASGGAPATVMADGVEAFQVLYGVDSDGDLSVDRYLSQPANWSQVLTVRVCVVVRAISKGTGPATQRYQDCSGATQTATDTYLRRVLSATFQLRNRSN